MIEVERHQNSSSVTYRVAGEPEEWGSQGNSVFLVKQNTVTVWSDGGINVTGKFTKPKLEAIIHAIVEDQRTVK